MKLALFFCTGWSWPDLSAVSIVAVACFCLGLSCFQTESQVSFAFDGVLGHSPAFSIAFLGPTWFCCTMMVMRWGHFFEQ